MYKKEYVGCWILYHVRLLSYILIGLNEETLHRIYFNTLVVKHDEAVVVLIFVCNINNIYHMHLPLTLTKITQAFFERYLQL